MFTNALSLPRSYDSSVFREALRQRAPDRFLIPNGRSAGNRKGSKGSSVHLKMRCSNLSSRFRAASTVVSTGHPRSSA